MAKAAVMAGLMLGVSGFAMAAPSTLVPSLQAAPDLTDANRAVLAAAVALAEHKSNVLLVASAAAEQAETVRADAAAQAVPADAIAPLDAATTELARLLSAAELADLLADGATTTQTAESPTVGATSTTGSDEPTVDAESSAPAATASPVLPSPTVTVPADLLWDPETSTAPEATGDVDPLSAAAVLATADVGEDVATAALRIAATKVAELTTQVAQATAASAEAAQLAADAALAAEAEAARVAADAATRQAQRTSLDSYANGRVPASALCAPSFASDALLRCDAAEALETLNAAFREALGSDIQISDSYRSYSSQVACRRTKGSLCASPGTSNHGLGLALDLEGGAQSFGTRAHNWLLANAEQYGWTLPDWARISGSKPEPWHWEYVG